VPRNPSISGINYHNKNSPEDDSYSYLVFERPYTTASSVQYIQSSTENPSPVQQSSFQKHETTLRTLLAGQNSLGFPHDTLSFDEVHKHKQRETSEHLVPPPPPPQQTEAPLYNHKQQHIQQTWQKLLREQQQQQQQDKWSPVPQPTDPLHKKLQQTPFSDDAQPHIYESQDSRQQQSQTEGPFRPNTNPYGDTGRFVGVLYKDNDRGVSDFYTNVPTTADPSLSNQHANHGHLRPPIAPSMSHSARQQTSLPNQNLTGKTQRNMNRSQDYTPVPYTPPNTQNPFDSDSVGNQPYTVRTRGVVFHNDKTYTPYEEYESVKLPVQTKNGKSHTSDYQDDAYNEKKPADYDEKAHHNDEDVLEAGHPRLEKKEPIRGRGKNSDSQHHNRGNTQDRRLPYYKGGHSNEELPQNEYRQPEKQGSLEQTYDGRYDNHKKVQRGESTLPNQSGSYNTETFDNKRSPSSDSDQTGTTSPYVETTTEDRFPPPPPEFFEEFNKFKHIENPFASIDFDFDAYLEKLRGPHPTSQQQPSKDQIKIKEPPGVNDYETEGDSIKSTTYENLVSTTTTGKPRIQQWSTPVNHEPSTQTPSQEHITEYIKEYYPPYNSKNIYNEGIRAQSEEVENQRTTDRARPIDSDEEVVQDSVYQKEHITTTTYAPKPRTATVNHHINPNPLTVPFYPGEDGNFYASQPQQPEANHAGESKEIQPPTGTYYKYSEQEENSDVIQSTERNPHIISTSETYLQPHRYYYKNSKGNANNHGPFETTTITPFSAERDSADSLHPVLDVVTSPSRGSKPPRRGTVRNRPQNSEHVHASQTVETDKINDNSRKNAYYGDTEYRQPNVTMQPQLWVKEESSVPHPLTATASSSNKYQYQDAGTSSTEFTPLAEPVASLTKSDTKQKKIGYSYTQGSVEENDTIKPLRDLKNERILQSHKALTTAIYTSTIPSTTEYFTTSSATQYNDWKTYNRWQGTTPYQKEVSNFELTTPIQPRYKVTDNISRNKFNSELDLNTPTLSKYTTIKLTNTHDTYTTNTPVTHSQFQTSTKPSNDLLDSIYDIAKTMFKPLYDTANRNTYFEPSSESANQDPVTEFILLHPNISTTTIPSTTRLKSRQRWPTTNIARPPSNINYATKYTTSNFDHTTPETYTTRHRPSKNHPSSPVRHRAHRPRTTSLPNTASNVILTTTLSSNDIDITLNTTVKSPSPIRSHPPVTPRRLRRPTKTRVDVTSTEAYADNDKSESFERPLQDSVNRLNKKLLGSIMTAAPHRYSRK
jgi:hypothetical protein